MSTHVLCRSRLVAERVDDPTLTTSTVSDGRWRINAGSEMIVTVAGLNENDKGEAQPIRLVIDLTSLRAKNARIHALADHDTTRVVGYWDAFEFGPEGATASLHLATPADAIEAGILADAVRLRALLRNGVPLQVSVGADAGSEGIWEEVTQPTVVNGMTYDAGGDGPPLYILRKGELFESSILSFGADDQTGRLAASKTTNPVKTEANMSDKLKALLGKTPEKHHGLVARCVAEGLDESATISKVHAAESDEKDKALAAANEMIEKLTTQVADLTAKCDDYAQQCAQHCAQKTERELTNTLALAGAKQTVKFGSTDGKKQEVEAGKVETMTQAMKVVAAANPNLKGFALRREARKLYPNAKEG